MAPIPLRGVRKGAMDHIVLPSCWDRYYLLYSYRDGVAGSLFQSNIDDAGRSFMFHNRRGVFCRTVAALVLLVTNPAMTGRHHDRLSLIFHGD